ncbi:MAG: MFS transporter, partial [Solirubrobacterales bacterium]|nr:MFS transporter [Solirubrobacterales bacterium]
MPGFTEANRKWWVLAGTSGGLFILMLDSTVVALALPSIQMDLGASTDQLQWVLNAYLLVIASLVVTAGRFGDIFGRRRVFIIGFAIFGLGSLISAVAWDPDVLILGRVVMAAGASTMLPLSLALVTNSFPPEEQQKAIGIWTGVSAIALGIGPLIGGVLADIDWRLIFLINFPIVAVSITVVRSAALEVRDETSGTHIDWPGLVLLTLGLLAAVYALVKASDWGWTSVETLGLMGLGIGLLAAFWFVEHRVPGPIVDFSLFRNRPYLGATAAAFGIVAVYWTLMFYEPQYLQNILGYSAVEAGLLILPITVPMIFVSPMAGKIVATFGAKLAMTTGMVSAVVGLLILTRVDASSGYGLLFPGLLGIGMAFALVYAPMSAAAMAAMPRAKAGIASAGLAMNRILAGAVGLAVVGAVFQSLEAAELKSGLAGSGLKLDGDERRQLDGLLAGSDSARDSIANDPASVQQQIESIAREAFTFALSNSIWVLVGIAVVCTGLTAWLVEPKEPTSELPEAAQ